MRQGDMGRSAMVCYGLALLAMIALPFCVAGSALHWLANGYGWQMTMADLLDYLGRAYPMQRWIGLQSIIDWYMGQKAYWAAPVLVTALFYALGHVCEIIRDDYAQSMKRSKTREAERERKKDR